LPIHQAAIRTPDWDDLLEKAEKEAETRFREPVKPVPGGTGPGILGPGPKRTTL